MSHIKLDKSEISLNERNSITGNSGLHNLTGQRTRFQPVRIKALLSLFESEDDDTEPRDSDNDSDTESLQALPDDEDDDKKIKISTQDEEVTLVQTSGENDFDQVGIPMIKNISVDENIADNLAETKAEGIKQTDDQLSRDSNSFELRDINSLPSGVRKLSFNTPFEHVDNHQFNSTPQVFIDPPKNKIYNQGNMLSNIKLEGWQENLIDFDNQSKPKELFKILATETPLKHSATQNTSLAHRNIFETPQTKLKNNNPCNVVETPGLIFSHWSWNNFLQTPTQNSNILNRKEGVAGQAHPQINHQMLDVRSQPHRFCNSKNVMVRKPLTEATHLNQGSTVNDNRSNHTTERHNFAQCSDLYTKENCPIDTKCNSKWNVANKIVQSLQDNCRQHNVNHQSTPLPKDGVPNCLINLEMGEPLPQTAHKEQIDYGLISNEKIVKNGCETKLTLPHQPEGILNSKSNEKRLERESRTRRSGSVSSHPDPVKIDLPLPVNSESDPVNVQYSVPAKAGDKKPGQMMTVKGCDYLVLGKLGHGMSGEVLRVQEVKTGELRAIKCVDLSCMEKENAKGCLEEVSMLSRLRAPCIVNMITFEIRSDVLYVVMEMGDTDLSTLLKSLSREKQLPLTMVLYYWTEMLTAVKHIHDNGVIHSDLKPANFLLVRGRLKLIDFGIASTVNADMTSVVRNSSLGTLNYMSPEAIINVGNGDSSGDDNQFKINFKSDVWSLGCILYSMVYGQTPFQQIRVHWAKINAITNPNEKIAFPPPESVNRRGYIPPPPFLVGVIQRCLQHDRNARPTVDQLLQIPYVGCNCSPVTSLPTIPPSILSKIKRSLEETEWRKLVEALEERRPIQ